jgi:hypothetical protein
MIVNSVPYTRARWLSIANRPDWRLFSTMVLVAIAIFTGYGSLAFAADPADPADSRRSLMGTKVPSSGTTANLSVSPQKQMAFPSSIKDIGKNNRGKTEERCTTRRKRYAQSEACFAHYRMKNRGLRQGAFQRCKQLKDPSWECDPVVVP